MWHGGRRPGDRPPARPRRAVAALAAGGLATTLVGGCSSGGPFAGSDIAPTGTPSASVTPVPQAPIGSRRVTGRGWSIAVPGQWEEKRRTLETGEVARWSERTPDGPPAVAVAVVLETKPTQSLLEQSYRLEQRLRDDERLPVRSAVPGQDPDRPGVLVQWQENSRGDETRREVWQLFLAGADGSIVNVVGYAPVDTFATSRVPEVMGTVTVTS